MTAGASEAWARDAAFPVRRGPAARLAALAALAALPKWLLEVKQHFESQRDELIEHVKTTEWFLDNYAHVERAVRQVRQDMPCGFFQRLPVLDGGYGSGLPRAYVLADRLLAETELLPNAASLRDLVQRFHAQATLGMAELWALPAFLRLCALEELGLALSGVCPSLPSPLSGAARAVGAARLDEDERVARCIRTLRGLDIIDWRAFFHACSLVERILEDDPAGVHARADFETRDRCRKQVEAIAWRARVDEQDVARAAVDLAREHEACGGRRAHVGAWLVGEERGALERRFGAAPPAMERLRRGLCARPALTLIGGIAAATALVLVPPGVTLARLDASPLVWVVALLLLSVPASTLGVSIVHWFLTNILPPRVLPKLDLGEGIPEDCCTLIVVPCLFGSVHEVQDLVRQLELHYLRNPDPQLAFALLSDWLDAPERRMPGDDELLERATAGVQLLNRKHGRAGHAPFHLLHREREWNPSEGKWMGWERKRGKLEQLNELLLGGPSRFAHGAGAADGLAGRRFVITLDAGTVLPTRAAARLIGVLAHPLNQAEFDERSGCVVRGYSVIQPRVEIAPTATAQSLFTRIFSGDATIDIYTRAVSDVYQDLCGSGIFVGKGIYDVASFARSLAGRVPQNALVSHDHFEGLHGHAALASDVVLYEDYPPQYLAYARRMHRWIRGDWQLLPWLRRSVPAAGGGRVPTRLSTLGRWILFDNLRRSLLAPTLVLLLASAWLWFPGRPLLWTALAILAPAGHVFTGLVSGLARGPRRARVRPWLAGIAHTLRQNVGRWVLFLVFLLHEALVTTDAIARTLIRIAFTHRRFLEWRSAEHTARLLAGRHPHLLVWTEMAGSPLVAASLLAAILARRPDTLPWAVPLLALWIAAPEIARRISRPAARERQQLEPRERARLRRLGRRTWFFFETFVGPADQWLPPDNYQEDPRGDVAHRTSPTNVGMYLVSTVAAHDLGWLGTTELASRLRSTLETLERMERYRGHLYNWYDTRTLEPLLPRYVSAVDSGNLAAALLVAQQTCAEAAAGSAVTVERWRGLLDGLGLLEQAIRVVASAQTGFAPDPLLERCSHIREHVRRAEPVPAGWSAALAELDGALLPALDAALMEELQRAPHVTARALREVRCWLERTHHHVRVMRQDVDRLAPWLALLDEAPAQLRSSELLRDVRAALAPTAGLSDVAVQSARLLGALSSADGREDDVAAAWRSRLAEALRVGAANARALQNDLLGFGVRAHELVQAMDFGLVYDRESHLLHIGHDVSSGRLDPNHYDLLASEARIASFLAIAKGDVPVKHWYFLGRPMVRVRGETTLLSWGGTMFEYLMPALFMRSGERTLLSQSCRVAVGAQIAYGELHDVPWGISESGFHLLDLERTYQYRAFGVPGLGLKRGLSDDLVVSPYSSALALEIRPRDALRNLERLEELGALGIHGLYEAIDFTPTRVPPGEPCAVVRSHMAHHQGMILAAIDNLLHGEPLVRRFHDTSLAQAAELLLHELVPVGVSPDLHPESALAPPAPRPPRRAPPPWQPVVGGPVPQTLVLSNGRLTTGLTDAGGGWTSWRGLALTRWDADPTRDDRGTWIYVRDEDAGDLWSAGSNPTGVRAEEQHVVFHAHMAELRRRDGGVFVRTEVAVAPREDVELRIVSVTNESAVPRRISVTSCLEPVLAPAADDARQPAFSKLFVETAWLPEQRALSFERRPRSPEERAVVMLHALVAGEGFEAAGHETDRELFLGRGSGWDRPAALTHGRPLSGTVGAVLDPVGVLQASVELLPGESARLAFLTVAASTSSAALESLGRFQTLEQIDWAFEDARAEAVRELQALRIAPRLLPVFQRLTSYVLHPHASLRCEPATIAANRLGQPGLWPHGISGDVPIVLARLEDTRDGRLLSELLLAHRWWRRSGLAVDLVLLLSGTASYAGDDDERVARLIAQTGAADWRNRRGGVFVLHAQRMRAEEAALLEVAARVVLRGADGRLADQLAARAPRAADLPPRFAPVFAPGEASEPTPALEPPAELLLENAWGGFAPDGRSYAIGLGAGARTPAPWCNVLANPDFGCLVSESGMGASWSRNSSERRLTPWRNDPVSDEPSEVVYLRDEETGAVWTPTPLPAGDGATTHVRHGRGWSEYRRASDGLEQTLCVLVPREDPLKIVSLRLRNVWARPRRLTVSYYAELVLGTRREEFAHFTTHEYDSAAHVLLARNSWNPEHAGRVAFLAGDTAPHGVTTDRLEFLGRNGSLRRPAALERWGFSGSVRAGVDPCQALMLHVELEPGEERTVHFFLGDAADRAHALELVGAYRSAEHRQAARDALAAFWDGVLGAVEVTTPEPAMDLALNGWLVHQTLASRLEGRTGFYQPSGAFGFRDQLQDVMALVHGAPERARAHILEAARRQFEQGDVLHWWHPPGARGVRTRCSDDLLWLPFVASHYARATGDLDVFGVEVPFLAGEPLGEQELERYAEYASSQRRASLLEHCRRALRRGWTEGARGLPLIGTCDWNDGFNRVGWRGRGESVWLAWFVIATARTFAEVLERLEHGAEADDWRRRAAELAGRVERCAWNGGWYLRAWFDDGTPLGSSGSAECRIDLIAQAWAALSGAGNDERVGIALDAARRELVSDDERLVRLLRPPFDVGLPDPGYIRAYPPGVRENGGQYTHAAAWLGWAFATRGDGAAAERIFRILNPLERGRDSEALRRYRVEPYVVAGDVYAGDRHGGRGGWTWYTGAAAWLWRLGVEGVLGIRREDGRLRVDPCIPPAWSGFEARVRGAAYTCRIVVENPDGTGRGVVRVTLDGEELADGLVPLDTLRGAHDVRVTLGRAVAETSA